MSSTPRPPVSSPLPGLDGNKGGEIAPRKVSKRPAEPSRAFYPRKRALAACEVCRKRKSKCDNLRPSCGLCQRLNAHCVYRDSSFDHSTYDLPSLEILERINYVAELLERHDSRVPTVVAPFDVTFSDIQQEVSPRSLRLAEDGVPRYEWQHDATILSESLEFAARHSGTCEDILEWPVFESAFHRADTETLIFNPDLIHSGTSSFVDPLYPGSSIVSNSIRKSAHGRGVQESDALSMVQRFLANVHIKNPILDAEEMTKMARDVMENGFRWDGTSCLILIACALASLSSPYTSEYITTAILEEANTAQSVNDAYDYCTAESYYVAAQKRILLLDTSILNVQCCFLSGVYEMCSLRPMRAWTSFNRACITFQVYLRSKVKNSVTATQRLERRLYWSCLKSECEIRTEICLPPSGLAKVAYPDVFPTPPGASPQPGEESSTGRADCISESSGILLDPELENSWSYYLSDIAVRRIGNRLMNSFYKEDESTWLSIPVDRLMRVAEELEAQLTQWYNHLPRLVATLGSSNSRDSAEELQHLLEVRLLEFRERIHRPFLYIAIHQPAHSPIQVIIEPYVQRCLDACLKQSLKGSHRHRHHGTWYQNRKIFAQCLLILAAVKSQHINVPTGWRHAVKTCIAGLGFWEGEAPDLGKAKLVLKTIFEAVDPENNYS